MEKSIENDTKNYVSVKISKELASVIDENIVGKCGYKNRDEVVKEMIEKQIPQYLETSRKSETVATYLPPYNPAFSFLFRL
jgi:metal-responsive CopG/Arc/MetJ family transcriptional regulator